MQVWVLQEGTEDDYTRNAQIAGIYGSKRDGIAAITEKVLPGLPGTIMLLEGGAFEVSIGDSWASLTPYEVMPPVFPGTKEV